MCMPAVGISREPNLAPQACLLTHLHLDYGLSTESSNATMLQEDPHV